jgi:hypothetical protein
MMGLVCAGRAREEVAQWATPPVTAHLLRNSRRLVIGS